MVQADNVPAESSEKVIGAAKHLQDEFLMRDFESYRLRNEAAAYRAGLSSAAGICDRVASEMNIKNRIGREVRAALLRCGDEISDFRERCQPDALPRNER